MGAAWDDDVGVLRQEQRALQGVMENFVSNIRKKIVEVEVTRRPPEAESAHPTTDATAGPEKLAHRIPQERPVYRMDWKDHVLLLESHVRKKLRLR